MKPMIYALLAAALLSACGTPRPMMYNPMYGPVRYGAQRVMPPTMRAYGAVGANGNVRSNLTPSRPKTESRLIPDRQVTVPRSAFDDFGDRQRGRMPAADPLFAASAPRPPASAGEFPFSIFGDLKDHVRYGYGTVYEDFKTMNEASARAHYDRYVGAWREIQRQYKASRDEIRRLATLDALVNSLEVEGRALPAENRHNPAANPKDKLLPTQAAAVMPSFGEMMAYNRSSYEVSYVRWDPYKAARHYQTNYARYFSLIMEAGPEKTDAWRLIHREISAVAAY